MNAAQTQTTVALARAAILRRLRPALEVLTHDPDAGEGDFTPRALAEARAASLAAVVDVLAHMEALERGASNPLTAAAE
jgi:hypothetical protein